MSGVALNRLLRVDAVLGGRERDLVRLISRLHLMSGAQVAAVISPVSRDATAASQAREVRRVLSRLTDLGVLARLQRRVGGVRAGSSGHVYYLGPVGQRLIAYWQGQGLVRGRSRPEPGERYLKHRLSVSQLYVDLARAEQRGELELLDFQAEPAAWRTSLDGLGGKTIVKPDAFVRLGVGAYEDLFFIEVDLGTEGRSVIAGKLRTYIDYFATGAEQTDHGVFPRVVFLTNSDARYEALVDVAAKLPPESWQLFIIQRLEHATAVLGGQLEDDVETVSSSGVQL